MREFKRDNRGVTLVELIVSITILAIIVLPLLSSFVIAARTNAKAKEKLRATNIAESIMEGVENSNIQEIAYQFNYPEEGFDICTLELDGALKDSVSQVVKDDHNELVKVIKREDLPAEISNPQDFITSAILKSDDGKSFKFIKRDTVGQDNRYLFAVTNLKSDNHSYNALIIADPKRGDSTTSTGKYNSNSIAEILKMDANYDAINANTDTPADVIKDIELYNFENIKQEDLKRTITIDITKNASGVTLVKSKYSYEFTNKADNTKVVFPFKDSASERRYTSLIYDNSSDTEIELRNIYLFYQPWYVSNPGALYTNYADNIYINNEAGINCNIFIIKQNIINSEALVDMERKYRVFVKLYEKNNNSGKALTNIVTNLDKNMADPDSELPLQQAYYMYNNNADQNDVKNMVDISEELNVKKEQDRVMDIEVRIFNKKVPVEKMLTETPVLKFTGSMVN